jgi:protoheme IX farnesyltransferase
MVKESPFAFSFRNYSLLTKPRIIMGNVITAGAGFALASHRQFQLETFLLMLVGISLVIASSCVYNNYIDRHKDKMMERTKNRPLAKGTISEKAALIFATLLIITGSAIFAIGVNLLAMVSVLVGFGIYVFLYSFSKYQTIHGTLIGSVAGAMPPVVGYTSASGHLDGAALLLFLIVALWQMPHFYAISIRRLHDYRSAKVPILPIKKGMLKTKLQMFFYIMAFTIATLMLTAFDYTGYLFMAIASILGIAWLVLCIRGLKTCDDQAWAKQMFRFSLIVIMGISFAIPFSL